MVKIGSKVEYQSITGIIRGIVTSITHDDYWTETLATFKVTSWGNPAYRHGTLETVFYWTLVER